jgi:hypothetical protein
MTRGPQSEISERAKVVKQLAATYRVERYVCLVFIVIAFVVAMSYVIWCLFRECPGVSKTNLLNTVIGSGGIVTTLVGLLTWQQNKAMSFIGGKPEAPGNEAKHHE